VSTGKKTQSKAGANFAVNTIQLLYAENVVSRKAGGQNQRIGFCVAVANLAYEKRVEIHWGTSDGTWRILPAHFARSAGGSREIWEAEASFASGGGTHNLPGDIFFAAHCAMAGVDYWDSNDQKNYTIKADTGVLVSDAFPLLAIKVQSQLYPFDPFLPITVAVHQSLLPQRVFVHWSTDHWRTTNVSECYFRRQHWEKTHDSNAKNPNECGTSIWITHLPINHAFRVEYAIGCATPEQTIWDNNSGENYAARHERLKVLTLNLHCYQEENQDAKLSIIAKAIDDHEVDIVCLQEVAEPWESGIPALEANTAKLIRQRLKQHYHLLTDWSHRGFDVYREGCAILSRHEILVGDSGYISVDQDTNSIHARKIVMAQINAPYVGLVNVYSAHLSWWKDGFRKQFENLRTWANEKHSGGVVATLLLGDFNAKPGSEGYLLATGADGFEDQFHKAHQTNRKGGILPDSASIPNDGRIDFIFLRNGSALEVKAAKALFTDADYGRVSDHEGYYAEFEPP
jgi:maltose 6'-phosphate phosphatase